MIGWLRELLRPRRRPFRVRIRLDEDERRVTIAGDALGLGYLADLANRARARGEARSSFYEGGEIVIRRED